LCIGDDWRQAKGGQRRREDNYHEVTRRAKLYHTRLDAFQVFLTRSRG